MGDMTDYYIDLAMGYEDFEEFNGEHYSDIAGKYLKGKLKWETKEGFKMLIKDMDSSHVVNTRNYLIQRQDENEAVNEWVAVFNLEIEKRNL